MKQYLHINKDTHSSITKSYIIIFSSILESLLIIPTRTKPVDTVQDLLESQLDIITGVRMADLMKFDPRQRMQKISTRVRGIESLSNGDASSEILEG